MYINFRAVFGQKHWSNIDTLLFVVTKRHQHSFHGLGCTHCATSSPILNLASVNASESVLRSPYMSLQWEVPLMKMAGASAEMSSRTPIACHGSIVPWTNTTLSTSGWSPPYLKHLNSEIQCYDIKDNHLLNVGPINVLL